MTAEYQLRDKFEARIAESNLAIGPYRVDRYPSGEYRYPVVELDWQTFLAGANAAMEIVGTEGKS